VLTTLKDKIKYSENADDGVWDQKNSATQPPSSITVLLSFRPHAATILHLHTRCSIMPIRLTPRSVADQTLAEASSFSGVGTHITEITILTPAQDSTGFSGIFSNFLRSQSPGFYNDSIRIVNLLSLTVLQEGMQMTPSFRFEEKKVSSNYFAIVTWLAVLSFGAFAFAADPQTPAADSQSKWEKDIQAFEQWDLKNSFPAGAVLFIGSSSIRMWETHASFPELPVINRGFGGSQIAEITPFVPRIVFPYRPRAIVFYAGDNDIAAGKSPQAIADDFRDFVRSVREKLADTPIYFLSIKPSPIRWSMWVNASKANELIRDFCRGNAALKYIDLASCLLQENGTPNPVLFLPDNLHLNAQGYKIWTQTLNPLLKQYATAKSDAEESAPAASEASSGTRQSAAPRPDSATPSSGPWYAAKDSKIFHRAGCSFLGRIGKDNLVEFATRDQAAVGRRPCKTCNP
jgi:lysophospholipase L1-like esterase